MIEQAIPPAVTQTAEDVLEIAKEAIEGVREWASEATDRALEKVNPKPKKKRSKLRLVLVLLGLGAVVVFLVRRRRGGANDVAPDAFGAAVEAEREGNPNGERSPLRTSGA